MPTSTGQTCKRRESTARGGESTHGRRATPAGQLHTYLSNSYLANTLSHTLTGQTVGGGEGTLTADGRAADQGVGRAES